MTETLGGLEGVAIFMDGILVYGDTQQSDGESAALKLNKEKCKFRQN